MQYVFTSNLTNLRHYPNFNELSIFSSGCSSIIQIPLSYQFLQCFFLGISPLIGFVPPCINWSSCMIPGISHSTSVDLSQNISAFTWIEILAAKMYVSESIKVELRPNQLYRLTAMKKTVVFVSNKILVYKTTYWKISKNASSRLQIMANARWYVRNSMWMNSWKMYGHNFQWNGWGFENNIDGGVGL